MCHSGAVRNLSFFQIPPVLLLFPLPVAIFVPQSPPPLIGPLPVETVLSDICIALSITEILEHVCLHNQNPHD